MAIRLSGGDTSGAAGGRWVGTEGGAERKEEEGGQEARDRWLMTAKEGQRVMRLMTRGSHDPLRGAHFISSRQDRSLIFWCSPTK
jgi:hypothetical protein